MTHKTPYTSSSQPKADATQPGQGFLSAHIHSILLAVVLLIGAILRFWYVFGAEHMPVTSDAMDYTNIAISILNRGTMSYGYDPKPSAYVMPGFPLFLSGVLSIFGQEPLPFQVVRFIFALMSLSWALLIYFMVFDLSENKWLALLAASMVSVYPPFIWSSERILTEVPYTFFVVLSLLLLVHAWKNPSPLRAMWAGIALGFSLLVRPIMAWFVPVFILFDGISRRSFRKEFLIRAVVLIGAMVVCLAPWIIRNYIHFKRFIPFSTSGGNPLLIGTYYGYNRTDPFPRGSSEVETDELQRAFARKRFFDELKKDPLRYTKFYLGKIRSLWTLSYGIYDGWNLAPYPRALVGVFHRFAVLFFLFGMIAVIIYRAVPWYLLVMFIIYHTLILVPFIGLPRYSFPMMPVMCALAAYGIWIMGGGFARAGKRVRMNRYGYILSGLFAAGFVLAVLCPGCVGRESWLALGLSPELSIVAIAIFITVILATTVLSAIVLFRLTKESASRKDFSLFMMWIVLFLVAFLTPAGGLNPLQPLETLSDGYTHLVLSGDTATKRIDLPLWIQRFQTCKLRCYAGFTTNNIQQTSVGIFINDHLRLVTSAENVMQLRWYEFDLAPGDIRGRSEITVSFRMLSGAPRSPGNAVAFLVGLSRGKNRGQNAFNGVLDDLDPYVEGKQTGSYKIGIQMHKANRTKPSILWWGSRH